MTVYIAFLRGVNVGGRGKVRMEELKELFESIGFSDVRTYIQSGNVLFSSEISDSHLISSRIEEGIRTRFSLNVNAITEPLEELSKIVDASPFKEADLSEREVIHVAFLLEDPSVGDLNAVVKLDGKGDNVILKGRTAYILCRNGFSNSPYNALERILRVKVTFRNFNTLKNLLGIGSSMEAQGSVS
jgi:uncharacterized protein (DUF1697 family)